MTCILIQVRGRLPEAATKFLGFVAGRASVVQASQARPPLPTPLRDSQWRYTFSCLLASASHPCAACCGVLTFFR